MKRQPRARAAAAAPETAPEESGVDQTLFLKHSLAAAENEVDQLRRRVAGLELTVTSQGRALDRARNHIVGRCEHAEQARDLRATLHAMQARIDELQAHNERYDARGWQARAEPVAAPEAAAVPKQRGGRRK